MTNPFLDEKAAAANNPFIGLDDGIAPTRPGPAVIAAQERQPDAWVNAKRRGQQLGIAPEVVERNPAEVSRLELRQSLDKMRRENPSLADWLMRDDNLTVAQDDTENLSYLGKAMQAAREYTQMMSDPPRAAAAGLGQFIGSTISGAAEVPGMFERGLQRSSTAVAGLFSPDLAAQVRKNSQDSLSMFSLGDVSREWLGNKGVGGAVESFSRDVIAPPQERQGFVTNVANGLGQVAGFIGLGLATGGTGVVAAGAAQGIDQQADQAEAAGKSGTAGADAAMALGATITAATERLGFGWLLRRLPPSLQQQFGQRVGTFISERLGTAGANAISRATDVAVAGAGEFTQELSENVLHNAVALSFYDMAAQGELADALRQGDYRGAAGVFVGDSVDQATPAGVVGALVRAAVHGGRARERGMTENEQVDTLTKIVQQSKTWQRDPAKMENAIASLKGAGVENVYLPGEAVMTLYQSSPEMAQVFEAAGVSRDKVNEAILTGADLSVPLETYLTRIAPQYHGDLGKFARLSPDTITEADADATDEQNAAVDRFLASVNEAPPEGDADMRVYNDVLGQLLGTYSQADAEVMAGVVNGMFRDGIARRAGVDPMELYQRYGLRVVDEMKRRYPPDRVHPEFDADLERLRTGDIPTEDVALGPTIGEFLSERGIRSAPNEPMSGEIRRLNENDRFSRAGRRRLVREDDPNALTLDYAREAAVEAGYLPEGSDINDLLDALENDARPMSPANPNAQDARLRLTSLADELARQGLDVNALSNGEVRRALMGEVAPDPSVMNFDQSGDAAFTESDYRPEVVSWAREKFGEMVAPNGRPAWQNFVAWFGDSKVVDEQGRPLVVYHGTKGNFDTFDAAKQGASDFGASGRGFYFSEDAGTAGAYATLAPSDGAPNVMPVYLAISNPLELGALLPQNEEQSRLLTDRAKAAGHDGIVMRGADGVIDEVIAFNPSQIKSATANAGNFDPSNPSILNQTAYHGTPHTVDRFSLQKIGTGEGAQAFGWGLYFASEKAIAEHYKKVLADGALTYDGELLKRWSPEEKAAQLIIAARNGDEYAAELMEPGTVFIGYDTPKVHAAIASMDAGKVREAGNLYRVEVPEDSDLLDWDKPLSEQPEKVREALAAMDPEAYSPDGDEYDANETGQMIYMRLQNQARDYAITKGDNAGTTMQSSAQKASLDLLSFGIPGLRYLDGNSRNPFPFDVQVFGKSGALLKYEKVRSRAAADAMVADAEAAGNTAKVIERPVEAGSHNYVIWDEGAISEPMRLAQQRRGYLQFGADRQFTIGLTEARNLSTFMHEIGHLGLEVMSDMAATDPVFAEEFGILTRWWQDNADAVIATADRDVRDTINAAGGADFLRMVAADFRGDYDKAGVAAKTALHEYFARGFERYLAEGKPPTPELARPFSRFKAWLKAIYKSLVNLNVDLNDEVRGFMARMIAGDEAVVEAERASVAEPLFKEAARAGMSEAKFKAYLELQAKAHEDAEARVTAEAYREVMREREAWWREESSRVEAEVRAEFEALPVYRAWEALARNREPNGTPLDTPQVKLSKDWLLDRYGQDWLNKNLLRKQVYSADGGVHGDVVAPMFGFNTGSELVEALSNAQPLAKAVRTETQNRMRERYGDMRNDGTLPEKAMRAVHGSRRVKVIEAEIAALAGLANEPAMTAKQARDWANRQLAGRTVRDVVPYSYLRAERKAAREAVKAAAAGKMTEALAASRRRLVNAVMYDEAAKVRDQFDRRSKWIKGLAKAKAQERLGKAGAEFRDQINGLLHVANVRPLSEAEQGRQKPLRAFVEQLQEQGDDTAVTEAVLALSESGRPMAMRDMTVGQFSDLYAAVKNLKHIATNTGKLLAAADKATLDTAAEAMALRAAETHPDRLPEMLSRRDATTAQAAVERLRKLATELDRPENIIEALDGGESGPWHDYYLEALNGAENVAIGLRRRVGTSLRALRKSMPSGFMRSLDEKVALPHGIGEVSRGTLLGMVLNTGNAQNLQRLRDGGVHVNGHPITLDEQQVQDLRDMLTPDEAKYVQGLWDAVNSLWPDIAALQTEMSGVPPEKVEAQAFTAAGVAMRGGYWPLAYDHGKSNVGERQADDDALRIMMGQAYTRATTPKGHTKSRVENLQAPLLLDFGAVMSRHLDNVMTDIAYRKAVKDTVRLLRHPKIKDAIMGRLGRAAYDNLKGQVAYAVSANDALGAGGWRWLVSKVVSNSAMSALALRPDIALGNYGSALLQGLDRVGVKSMLRGMWQNATSRSELTQKVSALSPMMAERLGEIDENYRRELTLAQGKRGYGEAYRRVMMTLHRFADHEVARAAWWGRYQEALAAGETSAEAVRLADKLIRQTQTAGARKDVSPIERDPAFRESRIFMGPMFVILGRLRAAARGEGATRTVGSRASSLMLQMFMAPAVFMLLAGRWPEDDDDDGEIGLGEWSTWLAVNTLLFPLQAVPILREAAGSIEAWATDRPINPRAAPTAQAAAGLAKASKSIAKNIENYGDTGEFDWYDMTRDLATMAGPLTGAPAGQIRVTTKTIEAIQDDPDRDKTELARMALYGPPRQ